MTISKGKRYLYLAMLILEQEDTKLSLSTGDDTQLTE